MEIIIIENPVVGGGVIKGWAVCTKPFAFKGKTMCQIGQTKEEAMAYFEREIQK